MDVFILGQHKADTMATRLSVLMAILFFFLLPVIAMGAFSHA